jgi:ketosteroid isomerase-like protein
VTIRRLTVGWLRVFASCETPSRRGHRPRGEESKARHTGIEFDSPLAYAWTLRDGKIVHFQSFLEPEDALEAAGLLE